MNIHKAILSGAIGLGCFVFINTISAQITVTKTDVSCHNCSDGSAKVRVEGGTPPYEYIWENGFTGTTRSGLAPGYYVVVVADSNNCTGSIGFTIGNRPEPPDPFAITVVVSKDPNDITGPAGYGPSKWVSVNDILPYRIRFENDPKQATAPVNKVAITHPIDKNADMFSFRLGDFSFRGYTFEVPQNTSYFSKRLNFVDSLGIFIDVTAGIDVTQKQAFWIFQTIDPVTGLPNTDPSKGFLLINDSIAHMGEGEVNFTIKPSTQALTGDTIHALADIVFDINEALRTNIEFNTIDAKPPISKIHSIQSISSDVLEVTWNGDDDINGSGIDDYTLLVSSNNQPYTAYASTSDTSYIFELNGGNEYRLQTVSKDYTKNSEALKNTPDTVFYLRPQVNLGNDFSICLNDSVELNAGSGFSSYLWSDNSTKRTLTVKSAGTYFVTAVKDTLISSDTVVISVNQIPAPSLHSNISGFCEGGSLNLDAGAGYKNYDWSTGDNSQTINVTEPRKYRVNVVDNHGCRGLDSLVVSMFSKPIFSLGDDIILEVGDTTILKPTPGGFTSYLWSNNSRGGSLMIIGKQSNIGNKEYWLRVTDGNQCQTIDTVVVTTYPSSSIRFIDDEITSVYLYPNPVNDILNLEIVNTGNEDITIELYTLDGKLISVKHYPNNPSGIIDQINMSSLPYGSYLIKASKNNKEITKTIIKQ
jgi:hypothetical protein